MDDDLPMSMLYEETAHKSPFRFRDPFKKDRDLIYQHIGLTKKITRYYQYGVISTLVIVTLAHQFIRLFRYLRLKSSKDQSEYQSSSITRPSFWSTQSSKLQSFLITKPTIPILSYLFSDYNTCILILIYYSINMFVFLYELPMNDSFNLALRAGLVSATNIPLLYLIPLKSGPLLYLIDQSYENMIIYHKFAGILVVVMALVHSFAFIYCLTWDNLLNGIKGQTGIIGISFFIIISIASTGFIRRRFYEFFYYLHLLSFVLFLPVFYRHHYVCKPFVIFVSCCLISDRVVRWISKIWIFQYEIKSIHPEDDMLILSINTNISQFSMTQRIMSYMLFQTSSSKFKWQLSNHLFLNIPGICTFQSHPFTIANTPNFRNPTLIIKVHSGFTQKLFQYSQINRGGICFIHGPYGNSAKHFPNITNPDPFLELPIPYNIVSQETSALLSSPQTQKSYTEVATVSNPSSLSSSLYSVSQRQKIVLIAGGAGISFTLPLLHIYHDNPIYDVSFIWIVKSQKPLRQIKFDTRDDILVWCTNDRGRPDLINLLYDFIHTTYQKVDIMACGPNSLIQDIKKFTKIEIQKGKNMNLITEEFSF